MTENNLTMTFTLDSSQRKAVSHAKGPVRIDAGPGSGKTATLVERTVSLIRKGVPSQNLLLITFTRKAAQEMRERLVSRLENLPTVGTFHSVCLSLIREHPQQCGFRPGVNIITGADQRRMLRTLCEERSIAKRADVIALSKMIDTVRALYVPEKGISVNAFIAEHIFSEDGKKLSNDMINTIMSIWESYAQLKRAENVIDLQDCVPVVLTTLRRYKELAQKLSELYQYIIVDEAQDMDHAQYQLISLIGSHQNIALVADINQSIYGWRGSEPELLMAFDRDFQATQIRLERNYRSTMPIVRASNRLIQHNFKHKIDHAFSAGMGASVEPKLVTTKSWAEFRKSLMANIAYDLMRGIPTSEIAILYRTNRLKDALDGIFDASELPYRWLGGTQTSTPPEISAFLAVVKLYLDDTNFAAFFEIGELCGVSKTLLQKVAKYCQKANADTSKAPISLLDACHRIRNKNMSKVADMLRALLFDFAHEKPSVCFKWLRASRLYRQWLSRIISRDRRKGSQAQKVAKQTALLDEYEVLFERFYKREMANQMDDAECYTALTDMEFLDGQFEVDVEDSISLGTIHRSKGLEWSSVHLIGMSESILPSFSNRRPLSAQALLEERRVCFVGITRAKTILRLYHSDQLDYGQYMINQLSPSRFIREMST